LAAGGETGNPVIDFVFQSSLLTVAFTLKYKVSNSSPRRPEMPLSRYLIATTLALAAAGAASAAPLTVTADGIEARGGTLYVGVQTQAQFMQQEGIAGERIEAPANGAKTFTFDVPEGEYSVSVWHDFNANGQFDMSETGLPADGWAMNNGDALRGPPTFEDVKVAVPTTGAAITLTVADPE